MTLPRGVMGLSAVCDCGISRSYSLSVFAQGMVVKSQRALRVTINLRDN